MSAEPKCSPRRFTRVALRWWLMPWLLASLSCHAATVVVEEQLPPNIQDYKTPETAETIGIQGLADLSPEQMGFLGIQTDTNADGGIVVKAIAPDSPAFRAGLESNDFIVRFEGRPVASPGELRQMIESNAPGRRVAISVSRGGETTEVTAKLASLGAVGRPLERIRLGVQTGDEPFHGGFPVEEVDADSSGARAGIRTGDLILQVDDTRLDEVKGLADAIENKPADEIATLTLSRDDNEMQVQARLLPSDGPDRPAGYFGFARRGSGIRVFNNRSSRDALRIAVIGVEFPDVKHNPMVTNGDWEREFFSTNSYTGRNATGQTAHGSVNDYYLEQSAGAMRVTGKMFDWIEVSKNRADYLPAASAGNDRGDDEIVFGGSRWLDQDAPLVNEVLAKLIDREGRDALAGYDAVVFLYAGGPATRDGTTVYWPHTTSMLFQYRRLRYVVSFEGGERMADISILCHELGHVLGLPDLYVQRAQNLGARSSTNSTSRRSANPFFRPNPNPYFEGVASWDVMSMQAGHGRPQHFSAWSKEQLGWLKPAVINPLVRQKLILAPVEKSTNQCFKIPLRPDGSEYLLLENRRRIGFDESVPAEGLLIWRVVYGRPVLEEAHGFTGANAARVDIRRIPFPTDRNHAFTPYSRPSSAAFTGAELPVYLTNIRRLPDGRITFEIGDRYD